MCKAACQNKCQPGAHFKDCGPKAYGQAHGHTKDAVFAYDPGIPGADRTAQHTPAVKIPVALGQGVLRRIQAAHEAARIQNAMHEACAIASAMAASATDDDGRQAISALISHTGTQEHATLQLMKLVGRIGLRNWFDGDFVALSQEEARRVAAAIDPAGFGRGVLDALEHKIRTACQ